MSYLGDFFTSFIKQFIGKFGVADIGTEITAAIEPHKVFSLQLGSYDFIITDAVVASWIVMAVIAVLAWLFGHRRDRMPSSKLQLTAESLINLLMNLCQTSNMTYDQAEVVVPFVGTIGLFITLTNLSSMFKIPPPAKNPAFPIALALFTIGYVIAMSVHFVGWKGFWHSLVYPKAMLLPFKVLDYFIKPMSLSLRLFGNVFGAFILMEFIYLILPAILPGVVGLWFDLADGILQAVIFTYLTITYIGEVLEGAHLAHAAQEEKDVQAAAQA